MKLAVMVVGPESTGTRNLTGLLCRAGCQGDDGHYQGWDTAPPTTQDPIVWRRSVPHGYSMPDLVRMTEGLRQTGYRVVWLICCREPWALSSSQVERFEALSTEQDSLDRITEAYKWIFDSLARANPDEFFVIPYEALILHPNKTFSFLVRRLGLSDPGAIVVMDQNTKHYG